MIRVYGWNAGRAGAWLGSVVLVSGCVGMYVGGRLCDHWHSQGRREAPLAVGMWAGAAASLTAALAFTAQTPWLALALMVPLVFCLAMPIGSMFAALQLIVPNQVRGQVSALYLFAISLVGITLGPLLPGLMTDHWYADPARIGSALAMSVGLSAIGMAAFFRWTFKSYQVDHATMHP